jgi:hypothetical protein
MKRLVLVMASIAAIANAAPAALAAAPAVIEQDFTFSTVDTSICSFPIELVFEGHVRMTFFFDQEGNIVAVTLQATDEATATANGKTLTGHEVIFGRVDIVKGTESDVGLPIHFNVTGGRALVEAGRLYIDSSGGVRFSGNFEFSEGDVEAFCAALS